MRDNSRFVSRKLSDMLHCTKQFNISHIKMAESKNL